jgi:bla regulator protein blaR1
VLVDNETPNSEIFQEKATPEMLKEYNKWAKHYKENKDTMVKKEVWERMKYIYSIMSPSQKKESEEFPSLNPKQIITVVEHKDSDKSRAEVRQEREVIREERKVQREEREVERKERREVQVERRERQRQVPPPPAPPVPPTPQEGEIPLPPPPPPVR